MALIFLLALIVSLTCLTCQRKTGAILCLLVIFPEILGIIFHKAGLLGFNMMARYALLGTIILINIRNIDCYFSNLWKNPLSTFLYIFTFVMILHNYFIVGGANTNPNIASFQLNVILRIIIPYSVLLIVCRATENLNEFCKWIPFWGVAFIVVFVVLLGIDGINISNRMTIEEETGVNSISLSRFSAITLLSSLVYFLYNETKKKYFYLSIIAIALFMLLLASQRATILGVGIASVLCLGTILLKQGKTNQFIKASIVIIALVAIFLTLFDFEILNRFNDLNNYKSFERYSDYSIAWNAFKESNFLTGLGSMGYHFYTGGFRPYPHSFILELMSEYGIVGLLYSLTVVAYGCFMSYKILTSEIVGDKSPIVVIPIVWSALLFSVLLSGSLLTNAVFLLCTCMLTLGYDVNNEYIQSMYDYESDEDES